MNTIHTTNNSLLLLTWGTGHGAQDSKATRSARAAKGAATRRRNRERAERAERLARLRRNGGTIIPTGAVIILRHASTPRLVAQEQLANASERERAEARRADRERGTRAAQSAAIMRRAGVRGAERAEAERRADAVAVRPPALAYLGTVRESEASLAAGECGELEARLTLERLASDALAPDAIASAERKTLRKGKRARARAERDLVAHLRPVHPVALADAGRPMIKREGQDKLTDQLSILAEASGRAFVRAWEAQGGREVSPSDAEEFANIYRAHFIRAALCGLVPPDKRSLFQRSGNVLPFRALRAWHRALRAAGTECRAYLWGKGWELCEVASVYDLQRMRAALMGAEDERCFTVSSAKTCQQEEPLEGEIENEARAARDAGVRSSYVRRLCARWGDYLRVYWMLSGSRKWKASLAGDLRLLASAARVARGTALEFLGDYLGEGNASKGALREAASQLRKRIAAGRVLATDAETTEAAEAVLEASKAARHANAAAKRRIAERERAERLALEVIPSAL